MGTDCKSVRASVRNPMHEKVSGKYIRAVLVTLENVILRLEVLVTKRKT